MYLSYFSVKLVVLVQKLGNILLQRKVGVNVL